MVFYSQWSCTRSGPVLAVGLAWSSVSCVVSAPGSGLDYTHTAIASAPQASGNDGAVMLYDQYCRSCSMFANSIGSLYFEGDEEATNFGSAVAVGVFDQTNVLSVNSWRTHAVEFLAVSAPEWNGAGGVHVFAPASYRYWETHGDDGPKKMGDSYCDRNTEPDVLQDRLKTLTGGFPSEEFGRSLAVADFTCDGYDDLAVGAPGADLPIGDGTTLEDAGAVYVFRGGPLGVGAEGVLTITQGLFGTEGEPEAGDRFGEVLAVGNFNGRRIISDDVAWSCWDLAVGTPGEDDSAGEVQIFYGEAASLPAIGPILRVGEGGIPGIRGADQRFGAALVGYRFNSGGFHDLAIGAPGDNGGRVVLMPGSSIGLDTNLTTEFSQSGAKSVPGDEFGAALGVFVLEGELQLVVGTPGEDGDLGAITLIEIAVSGMTGLFIEINSLVVTPGEVGLPLPAGLRWGSSIAAPRAFPTFPIAPF